MFAIFELPFRVLPHQFQWQAFRDRYSDRIAVAHSDTVPQSIIMLVACDIYITPVL